MSDRSDLRNTAWHTLPGEDVLSRLETDPARGLSSAEAERRLDEYGANRIRTRDAVAWWRLLVHQFADPLIYILILAAVVSVLIDQLVDAIVIAVVVLLNAAIGFVQELRARKAIRSLAAMAAPRAHVIRDGSEQELESECVVPGDILVLSAGGRVTADARLIDADDLQADESTLTGESEPVTKRRDPVPDERAVPGDQLSIVFSGTSITRGRGRGVVVRTGDDSELGHIALAAQDAAEVKTPIKEKMERLGRAIGAGVLVLAVLMIGGGLAAGVELSELVRTAVAMAVAAVPEALPVVLTITLAVGMRRMASRRAIIRSLPAVETLGSTTVVGADKTGTLTANRMTVKVVWTAGRRFELETSGDSTSGSIHPADASGGEIPRAVRLTMLAGLLANEARWLPQEDGSGSEVATEDGAEGGGDPTELALLVSATKAGLTWQESRAEHPQLDSIPFESDRQFMATLNETAEGRCVFVKGSPEAVLERCTHQLTADGGEEKLDANAAREQAEALAGEGYRVLAMAIRRTDRSEFDGEDPGSDLVFAGFQAMEDPLRPEALDAVAAAHEAGIRVIMLTGDHVRTARAIGSQLGLLGEDGHAEEGRRIEERSAEELDDIVREVNVFARVSPEHKLRLVERLKSQGHIVAVTGDGVNDAPALQAAHLGVAMGQAGTDVAREASDMVLTDDNFASITNAVEEGRVVFSNIRKVTYFLLSTAIGLTLVILSSLVGPWALPFVPVQVLWINLVTNGLQDVALAVEKGEPGLLRQPPRDPREGVIDRMVLWRLAWAGAFIALGTLGTFWWLLRQDVPLAQARSIAMTQMVVFQFFHVLNARSFERSVFRIPLTANPFLALSLVLALGAHLAALYVPVMQRIFETEPLSAQHWALVLGVGVLIIVAAEIDKVILRRRGRSRRHAEAVAT